MFEVDLDALEQLGLRPRYRGGTGGASLERRGSTNT